MRIVPASASTVGAGVCVGNVFEARFRMGVGVRVGIKVWSGGVVGRVGVGIGIGVGVGVGGRGWSGDLE